MRQRQPKALLFDLGGVVIGIQFDRCFEVWAAAAGKPFATIKSRFAFDEGYAAHECAHISGEEYHQHVCRETRDRTFVRRF